MVTTSILTTLLVACSTLAAATPVEMAGTNVERADSAHGTKGAAAYVNKRSCPGSEIDSGAVGKLGRWHLFYSSANGGTNCLYIDNTTGKRQGMIAELTRSPNQWAWDAGQYESYAGSVRLFNVAGKCIWIRGGIAEDYVHLGPFHCK